MELLSEMGGDGFEPSKSLTTDLQSAPFGHSGIHPYTCNADQSNDEHCYEQCRSRKLRLLDQVLRTITSNADLANFVCSIKCFALLQAMPISQTSFARSSASHYYEQCRSRKLRLLDRVLRTIDIHTVLSIRKQAFN